MAAKQTKEISCKLLKEILIKHFIAKTIRAEIVDFKNHRISQSKIKERILFTLLFLRTFFIRTIRLRFMYEKFFWHCSDHKEDCIFLLLQSSFLFLDVYNLSRQIQTCQSNLIIVAQLTRLRVTFIVTKLDQN